MCRLPVGKNLIQKKIQTLVILFLLLEFLFSIRYTLQITQKSIPHFGRCSAVSLLLILMRLGFFNSDIDLDK